MSRTSGSTERTPSIVFSSVGQIEPNVMIAMFMGDPFLTHYHLYVPVPGAGDVHLSTTLLFDIGVYLLVVATAALLISVFAEAAE